MSTLDFTREQLAEYILNTAKESSISKIKSIILNESKGDDIVAYSSDGKPLNLVEYVREIEIGVEDIKAGRVITDEDLSKEIESW